MDTTPKYILMSEKAIKIQEGWKPELGDWAYSTRETAKGVLVLDVILLGEEEEMTWLPRQDQLQKMIFTSPSNCWFKLASFETWKSKIKWPFKSLPSTMEQLWLAFVMHKKYSKQWDGKKEEWVNI